MKYNFLLISYFLSLSVTAQEFFPEALIKLDSYFSHHIIIAEKSTHKLFVYKNESGTPKLLKEYQMATGKKAGDKQLQGDHRTPEGIYYLTDFLTHKDLISRHGKQGEIYGVGAFVLNYPNPIDKKNQKTGGGIWLHSTNDETRIEKGLDSRGCIVTANAHLIEIANYIELNKTQVIVVQDLKYLSKASWEANKNDLEQTISQWRQAWRNESIKDYISFYHPLFRHNIRGNKEEYRKYKRAVFSMEGEPEIRVENLSIIANSNYAVATFKQRYRSNTIEDLGKKTLYLKKDSFYRWKIISEQWSKNGISSDNLEDSAFKPSMRFFETNSPQKILGDRLVHLKKDEQSKKNN